MRLIFIYSAKAGLIADLDGALKKAFSGGGACALCNITYGVAMKKGDWSSFEASLNPPPRYYHSDEIPEKIQQYLDDNNVELPVVLQEGEEGYNVIVTKPQLEACNQEPTCLIEHLQPHIAK